MAQLLAGQPIVLNDGTTVDAGDYLKDKVVAIYFSAMWCPPCRAFTPKLKV
jgi:nucleoredoxin